MEKIDLMELNALAARGPQRFGALIDEVRDRTEEWAREEPGVNAAKSGFNPNHGVTWVTRWGEAKTNATFPLEPEIAKGLPLLLEWSLRKQIDGPYLGRVVFAAGLTWYERDEHESSEIRSRVADQIEQAGKDPFAAYDDELPRLYRWLEPETLTNEDNFEGQVEALTRFIVGSFNDLIVTLGET